MCDNTPDNTGMPINALRLLVSDTPVNDLVCLIMLMNTIYIYVLGTNNCILQFFKIHKGSLPALSCYLGHCTL